MSQVELIMPKMGESVAEATIIKWLKNEGDKIALDEPILEIATDKVDSEIPSPFEGILTKKLFKEGDVVQVGKAVAQINTDANATPVTNTVTAPIVEEKKQEIVTEKITTPLATPVSNNPIKSAESSRFYSPLVRNIAKKEGVTVDELESITGSGAEGRVTKNDILAFLPNKGKQTIQVQKPIVETTISSNGNGASVKSEPAPVHAPKITLMNAHAYAM